MGMDMEWMWRQYDDKARADEIAERKLAEHQAYLQQENERQLRQAEALRQQGIMEAAQNARAAAEQRDLEQLQKANENATRAFKWMELGDQLGTSGAYQEVLAQQAAHEADVARFQQLAAKREARQRQMLADPNFKMAAMLAMGGQPGALQSMLTLDAQARANGTASKAQTEMDALEDKMVNDIFALSNADPDQFDKITTALIPLYKNKFEEAEKNGGKSRLGGWDKWEAAINGGVASNQDKKDRAAMMKEYNELSAKKHPTDAEKARLKTLSKALRKK